MRDDEKYEKLANHPDFQKLLKIKVKFIVTSVLSIFILFLALPVLTSYTTILNHSFIGPINWAWFWAFMLFIMTWFFCILYTKKANSFDELTEQIKADSKAESDAREARL